VGREVRVFACLLSEETGLAQHLQAQVLPWVERRMPWLRGHGMAERRLLHRHDPTMDTKEGGDIEDNAVRRVRRALGGSCHPGKVAWGERIGPLLDLFNQGNGQGGMALQIDPGPDTLMLRRALAGEWYYAVTRAGTVVRDLPFKPNHPFEDAGDALCYFAGGVAPQLTRDRRDPRARGQSKTVFEDDASSGAPSSATSSAMRQLTGRSSPSGPRAPSKTVFNS
jgi:hypothetical protein